jgi:F0F1-type ATP synthase, gamma subunit
MPESGLVFWMLIVFGIVLFILAKWGFPVITGMDQFNSGKIDEVKIIYHHFKSRGMQELLTVTFLPFDLSGEIDSLKDKGKLTGFNKYIVEPSAGEVVDALLPKVICLDLFTALADSNASEHDSCIDHCAGG